MKPSRFRLSAGFPETLICLVIATLAFVVYGQNVDHQFQTLDDGLYVTDNYFVQQGLTWEGYLWAISNISASANWHPLTWMSHMADFHFFGLYTGGHKMTNLVLHIIAALLLFAFVRRLTLNLWVAAFAAAVFALHPANVENVAWISQRKSMLSAIFWFAALIAYLDYVRAPSFKTYGAIAALFLLGLAAKPAVVTLPCVLLLLDIWPLGRLGIAPPLSHLDDYAIGPRNLAGRLWFLIREKLPLFGIAVFASVVTYIAQDSVGAVASGSYFSLSSRLGNASVALVDYTRMFFWPSHLALFYPLKPLDPFLVTISCMVLLLITVGSLFLIKHFAWITVGWFWFLGTLVPMVGIIQVGSQRMADRYLYLPMLGLAIGLFWSLAALRLKPYAKLLIGVLVVSWLWILTHKAYHQTSIWSSGVALYQHALKHEAPSSLVLNNLAIEHLNVGELDEAEVLLNLRRNQSLNFVVNRAGLHLRRGEYDEAISLYRELLLNEPNHLEIQFTLAMSYANFGNPEKAREHMRLARSLLPPGPQWRLGIERIRVAMGPNEVWSDALIKEVASQSGSRLHGADELSVLSPVSN